MASRPMGLAAAGGSSAGPPGAGRWTTAKPQRPVGDTKNEKQGRGTELDEHAVSVVASRLLNVARPRFRIGRGAMITITSWLAVALQCMEAIRV